MSEPKWTAGTWFVRVDVKSPRGTEFGVRLVDVDEDTAGELIRLVSSIYCGRCDKTAQALLHYLNRVSVASMRGQDCRLPRTTGKVCLA